MDKGEEIPTHKKLPTLEEIFKMQQAPWLINNTAFTFVVEQLVRTIVGNQKWETTRSYAPVTKHILVSDEAFMLLQLENHYGLWMECATSRVGWGKYTKNDPNKKFCGWSNEGMLWWFNQRLKDVHTNWNKQYSKDVEAAIFKTLADRCKNIMAATGKNGLEHHFCHMSAHLEAEEEEDDDSSFIPQDELIFLLVNSVEREEVQILLVTK